MLLSDVMYRPRGTRMELFANKAGFELANSHYPGGTTVGADVREVRCYPPVSQPLSRDLTPLAQIAQHAERLFEELLSHSGEVPQVVAQIICGDENRAILRLLVGPCPPAQAYRALALVGPLNEGMPSTHLLEGCISGAWRIDKLDIANDSFRPHAQLPVRLHN